MSHQLTESQLSILQKGKLRGKVTLHTAELETYEFEAKITLEHKVTNGCVLRIDNKIYPVASPIETIFSFERRWDNTLIFLLALMFEMLVLSLYLNINLWYTLEFRPDTGGYAVLILSFLTTFMAAYYAVKQQVLSVRLKEIPLAPSTLYASQDDTGLEQRIKTIRVGEGEVLELLAAANKTTKDVITKDSINELIQKNKERLLASPEINYSNTTIKHRPLRSWRLKAAVTRTGDDVIFMSAFDIPEIRKESALALDQLRKTERIPSREGEITETLNLRVLKFLKDPNPTVKFLLQSFMYYTNLAYALVEVISNKNVLFKAKNNALTDSVNRYSVALADQRLIAQDIDPQITSGSKRSANVSQHFSNNWWIYAVAFACAIALFIYIAAQQGWF